MEYEEVFVPAPTNIVPPRGANQPQAYIRVFYKKNAGQPVSHAGHPAVVSDFPPSVRNGYVSDQSRHGVQEQNSRVQESVIELMPPGAFQELPPALVSNDHVLDAPISRCTWIMNFIFAGVQFICMILCIAALATKSWCSVQLLDIGLSVMSSSGVEVKLSDVVADCSTDGYILFNCSGLKFYYICAIVMQILGAIAIVSSALAIVMIIWMRFRSSFSHPALLGLFILLSFVLWAIGLGVMIFGFLILRGASTYGLSMSTGFGVAFTATALLLVNIVLSHWCKFSRSSPRKPPRR